MPVVSAFIDALRDAFGRAEVDAVIRDGLKPGCAPMLRVYASEGGQVIGVQCGDLGTEISVTDMRLADQRRVPVKAAAR